MFPLHMFTARTRHVSLYHPYGQLCVCVFKNLFIAYCVKVVVSVVAEMLLVGLRINRGLMGKGACRINDSE